MLNAEMAGMVLQITSLYTASCGASFWVHCTSPCFMCKLPTGGTRANTVALLKRVPTIEDVDFGRRIKTLAC